MRSYRSNQEWLAARQVTHVHRPDSQSDHNAPKVERVASECDLYGHDYQVRDYEITADFFGVRIPKAVVCPVCGKSWKVER